MIINNNTTGVPTPSGGTLREAVEALRGEIDKAIVEYAISASEELEAAKRDIAALLWLNGNCEYCCFGKKTEYSGAVHWSCKLEPGEPCTPEWRGTEAQNETNL